ncbi:MAG: acyltransferase [Candidatus Cloacimonetes bacterium]|nr:acyltransferase [Candidatus Cloacimonadota bacterium]
MKVHPGLGKKVKRIITTCVLVKYSLLRKLYGLNHAINYLARSDKTALVKVLKKEGAKIGQRCDLNLPIYFHELRDPKLLSIGDDVHIGRLVLLDLSSSIVLKDRVTISMGSMLITHLDVGNSQLGTEYPSARKGITIDHDSYLGCQATVLSGVNIGSRCLIGAKSLVTKDVSSGSVAAGIPARILKQV